MLNGGVAKAEAGFSDGRTIPHQPERCDEMVTIAAAKLLQQKGLTACSETRMNDSLVHRMSGMK